MDIRRTTLAAVASIAVLLSVPATARSQSATTSVERAVAAWKKVRTLGGTFEQTLTNPLMRSTATARGEFKQQQPNKLAVRFTDPAGDAIVADGKFLWVYLQKATPGQVMRLPATDRMAIPIDAGQFLDSPEAKYDIVSKGAEAVGARQTQALSLTPKKGMSAPFTRATVWVDDADGLIRQFEVVEPSGLIRRIRLTKLDVNPAVSANEFKFVVPSGVKIVER